MRNNYWPANIVIVWVVGAFIVLGSLSSMVVVQAAAAGKGEGRLFLAEEELLICQGNC